MRIIRNCRIADRPFVLQRTQRGKEEKIHKPTCRPVPALRCIFPFILSSKSFHAIVCLSVCLSADHSSLCRFIISSRIGMGSGTHPVANNSIRQYITYQLNTQRTSIEQTSETACAKQKHKSASNNDNKLEGESRGHTS